MNKIKRIPYGISDFEAVNSKNEYYVDKTMFIPEIEKTKFVFLIRPRRFGKSLLLSTLQAYYDIKYKDKFEEMYRDTWILNNPTEERAKYLTLYFNFSAILKDKDKVQYDFNRYCNLEIDTFMDKYHNYIPKHIIELVNSQELAHEKLHILASKLREQDYKIYLFIDEYDNFTNTLLTDFGEGEYKRITRQAGYFKQFFTNLKLLTSGTGSGLARLFITGVSPVTMDDVTSGFNIGDNISTDLAFNELLGFAEKEVSDILDYYISVGELNIDKVEAMTIIKKWYDNYTFSTETTESVHNSDAILYFVHKSIRSKKIPDNLIDDNLRMDYGKLQYLIIQDKALNGNFKRLTEIINNGGIPSEIKKSFPFDQITQQDNFISLLYFFGLLSFSGQYVEGLPFLHIPNETIKQMVFEYIRRSFENAYGFSVQMYELLLLVRKMAYRGEFKEAFEFIENEIKKQSSLRDFIDGETFVKAFYLSFLNIYDFYISASEEEMNKGYADLIMKPFYIKYKDIKFAYLIELKYIPRSISDKELEKALQQKIDKATKQLGQYSEDEYERQMLGLPPYGMVSLKKVIIVFHGWELAYCEEI
ncbi:MAG TPA: AAA family ATPase [Candidatus Cloacimonadota bacterium]|nr:AAA family ATPase [Candidatus Cloacimonadota bacterium]